MGQNQNERRLAHDVKKFFLIHVKTFSAIGHCAANDPVEIAVESVKIVLLLVPAPELCVVAAVQKVNRYEPIQNFCVFADVFGRFKIYHAGVLEQFSVDETLYAARARETIHAFFGVAEGGLGEQSCEQGGGSFGDIFHGNIFGAFVVRQNLHLQKKIFRRIHDRVSQFHSAR